MKVRNCPKIALKPNVNVPVEAANPTPKRPLNSSKNSVDATLSVRVVMTKPV